jgi:hypothetical protein
MGESESLIAMSVRSSVPSRVFALQKCGRLTFKPNDGRPLDSHASDTNAVLAGYPASQGSQG